MKCEWPTQGAWARASAELEWNPKVLGCLLSWNVGKEKETDHNQRAQEKWEKLQTQNEWAYRMHGKL